jgi:hypothetical protein
MAVPDTTTKPATETVSGLQSLEQLGGPLDKDNTTPLTERQTQSLRQRFALTVIASLAFAGGPR